MNVVIFNGTIKNETELKVSEKSNISYCKFTVMVQKENKENMYDYIPCLAFGKNAEKISRNSEKGSQIEVEGSINNINYLNKEGKKVYYYEIVVKNAKIIGNSANKSVESPKKEETTAPKLDIAFKDIEDPFNLGKIDKNLTFINSDDDINF